MFSLRAFYVRRLKPISAIRRVKDAVWETVWRFKWTVLVPFLRRVFPDSVRSVASSVVSFDFDRLRSLLLAKEVPLVSLSSLADTRIAGVEHLQAPEHVAIQPPLVYPCELQSRVVVLSEGFDFPGIEVFQIERAKVSGRSNLVVTEHGVLHHGLYRFSHDFTSEELHGKIRIFPERAAIKVFAPRNSRARLEAGAVFTDACAFNYAHWLTEVLPRLCLFCSENRHFDVPLIVDAGLHPNIEYSLMAVSGNAHPIVKLEDGESVEVKRLLFVSPTGYVPFQRRAGPAGGHVHGAFSPHALTRLRERLAGVVDPASRLLPTKIVLRRRFGMRMMLNARAVEAELLQRGFSVIEPENLTFSEQYHVFSNAEIVVGATGAAFANLIFCSPRTRLVICLADHPHMIYGYWQAMAGAVGCRVTYVLGTIQGSSASGIHSDFQVSLPDVLAAISS